MHSDDQPPDSASGPIFSEVAARCLSSCPQSKDLISVTGHVGTAALGCPAERSSASLAEGKSRRALLDRTAEGGCPHVDRGTGQLR